MACPRFVSFKDCKDPDSNIPYSFDWSAWTTAAGNTLVNNPANVDIIVDLVDPSATDTTPIVVGDILIDVPNSIIYFWMTGGTLGLKYNITCRITASDGIIEDRTGVLEVGHK